MFPRWVVMLEQNGADVRHEFFYNGDNARSVFRKAQQADPNGFYTLEGELADGNWGTRDAVVKIRALTDLNTQADRHRKSLLNLAPGEADELAASNDIPVAIILELVDIERFNVEGNRGYSRSWSGMIEAKLLKNLPCWLARYIIRCL